jgi:hypothetical protein
MLTDFRPGCGEWQLRDAWHEKKGAEDEGFTSAARDNVFTNRLEAPERIDYVFFQVSTQELVFSEVLGGKTSRNLQDQNTPRAVSWTLQCGVRCIAAMVLLPPSP